MLWRIRDQFSVYDIDSSCNDDNTYRPLVVWYPPIRERWFVIARVQTAANQLQLKVSPKRRSIFVKHGLGLGQLRPGEEHITGEFTCRVGWEPCRVVSSRVSLSAWSAELPLGGTRVEAECDFLLGNDSSRTFFICFLYRCSWLLSPVQATTTRCWVTDMHATYRWNSRAHARHRSYVFDRL